MIVMKSVKTIWMTWIQIYHPFQTLGHLPQQRYCHKHLFTLQCQYLSHYKQPVGVSPSIYNVPALWWTTQENARQPPALPTKRNRRSAPWSEMGRTPSQYDNVLLDDDALSMGSASQYNNALVIVPPEGLDKKANPDNPPPLPKKTRVKQYLNVFSDYSEPHKDDLLPDTRTAQRYQVQPESAMVEPTTLSPPPALPPKKRSSQEMNCGHDMLMIETKVSAGIDADVPDGCRSHNQSSDSEDTTESKILGNKEELWFLCVEKLNRRLMFKREDEDGPDLKAGSVNALITRTTVTKDLMYNEAFLTTYRTFMSAHELITRLKYRYPYSVLPLSVPSLAFSVPSIGLLFKVSLLIFLTCDPHMSRYLVSPRQKPGELHLIHSPSLSELSMSSVFGSWRLIHSLRSWPWC
uniref:N-terminal Ras-GEF domain-containing protein n=1 Tax=Eptatretus burgeri TaxID=7764 RepID=A0A8C4NDB7_EPTBU